VDVAVLRGDPSDGLPGVAGIGAKTAVALVMAFGDLEGVLAAADPTAPVRPMTARLAQALTEGADVVRRARQVTSVVRDLPLPAAIPTAPPTVADPSRLTDLAEQWGVGRQVADLQAALHRGDAE
jgi:5'-3' exonuclease